MSKAINKILTTLTKTDDSAKALQICRDGLEEFPDNYQLHCFAGKSAKLLNDIPCALDFLEKATVLQPMQETAWQGLEELYAALHSDHSGTTAQKKTDEKWIDVLEKWVAWTLWQQHTFNTKTQSEHKTRKEVKKETCTAPTTVQYRK